MKNDNLNYQKREGMIRAIWCVNSETSEECLVDIDENKIIAKRIKGKIVDPGEIKCPKE